MLGAMESQARQIHLVPAPDGRQSETALAIARGTARLLRSLGFSCVSELPLPSGRRADLVALNERGEIWIVEIKSSVEDLRADQKWHEYRAHCDRLFFAFTQDLPCEIFPAETGLIVADAYGAHLHCEAPEHRLAAPTRKQMTIRFAMAAAAAHQPPDRSAGARRVLVRDLILRSIAQRCVSKDEPHTRGPWFETREDALLTMRQ